MKFDLLLSERILVGNRIDVKKAYDSTRGLSGTELQLLGQAEELAKLGHEVRVYSQFVETCDHNGVHWNQIENWNKLSTNADVAIAYHDSLMFKNFTRSLRIAQHHTYIPFEPTDFHWIDVNTSPSQAACDYMQRRWAPNKNWCVLPNGVDRGNFPTWNPVPGRITYHSSASRGLDLLLKAFPKIRDQVPNAHLRIIGDMSAWINAFSGVVPPLPDSQEQARRVKFIQSVLPDLEKAGHVKCLQGLSRNAVLAELAESSCFAFPCSLIVPAYKQKPQADGTPSCETFSVSVMEACKIGVPVILSPADALESIYKGAVKLTPTPPDQHIDEFASSVVEVLRNSFEAKDISGKEQKLASQYTMEAGTKVLTNIVSEFKDKRAYDVSTHDGLSITPKRIMFVLEPWFAPRPFDHQNLLTDSRGLTGSEVTLFMLAAELASYGHKVSIYSTFNSPGEFRGVKCVPFTLYSLHVREQWDAIIAWMQPTPLQQAIHIPVRLLNQQVNDFDYCAGWENYITHATSPSQHHMSFLQTLTPFQNWQVLPNGVDASLYPEVPFESRCNGRMIWASSPDRGLHWLLEAFPKIKRKVPHATLDVYYNWDTSHEQMKTHYGEMGNRIRYIAEAVKRMSPMGVTHKKSVSRSEIVKVMLEGHILPYCCDTVRYTEGFSVTTLEAAVSGCLPIIAGVDSLESIYGDHIPTVRAPYHEHKEEWIDLVVEHMLNKDLYVKAQKKARELANIYSWPKLGRQLESILFR